MKRTIGIILTLSLLFTVLCGTASAADTGGEAGGAFDGQLREANGMMQPMLQYSDMRAADYSNEDSDILRYCVYVETDHDTDQDGMADLVKVLVQVPRAAAEGQFQAATIYDPTPYGAGTVEEFAEDDTALYIEEEFDYSQLYNPGTKRTAAGEMSTLEAAREASPQDWNYSVPNSSDTGYSYAQNYDYFLIRGFAVVEASGIGTYGSEGFELCGTDLECDCHKCVVEWLTGDRVAYTDKTHNIAIKADWSNGNVAMTGCSYGGTLPFEVATTGVEGLKTIIPYAGIASWYDYTNSQGVPIIFNVNYTDYLAAYNCGGTFLDDDWTVPNELYGAYLWQVSRDQEATNGDYAPVWDKMNYSVLTDKINCSALVVQGLNDFNVMTKHADMMMQAFEKAGQPAKLVLHQDGHNVLDGLMVNGELWEETVNRWLSHWLYGVENGAENMAAVTVQSNIDGEFRTYDSWRDFEYAEMPVYAEEDFTDITTEGLAEYAYQFTSGEYEGLAGQKGMEYYYASLDRPWGALYEIDVPEGTTICGVPEIHVKMKTDVTDKDGLMVTAVLIDVADEGEPFHAFMVKDRLRNTLPRKTYDSYDLGGGYGEKPLKRYVQSRTTSKCVTFGWTDLCNPGRGYSSSEYTESEDLQAGQLYDYTFYMLPTAYTVAPGHHLMLMITSWDPYRAFLDEDFSIDPEMSSSLSDYQYAFTVDNSSLKAMIPLG